eukprot:gene9453-15160_t
MARLYRCSALPTQTRSAATATATATATGSATPTAVGVGGGDDDSSPDWLPVALIAAGVLCLLCLLWAALFGRQKKQSAAPEEEAEDGVPLQKQKSAGPLLDDPPADEQPWQQRGPATVPVEPPGLPKSPPVPAGQRLRGKR